MAMKKQFMTVQADKQKLSNNTLKTAGEGEQYVAAQLHATSCEAWVYSREDVTLRFRKHVK